MGGALSSRLWNVSYHGFTPMSSFLGRQIHSFERTAHQPSIYVHLVFKWISIQPRHRIAAASAQGVSMLKGPMLSAGKFGMRLNKSFDTEEPQTCCR